jgi:hypothetical protein
MDCPFQILVELPVEIQMRYANQNRIQKLSSEQLSVLDKTIKSKILELEFLEKVNKESGVRLNNLQTDCWEWTGGFMANEYGQLKEERWGEQYTHRWSYTHFKGEIEDGKCILHQCDNRKCVNPDHLISGSKAENNKEARERNPIASGRKLQDTELPKIAERMETGELLKDIAKEYNMNWKCVSRRLEQAGIRPEYKKGKKEWNKEEIVALREQGLTYKQISEQVGLSQSKICMILKTQ